MNQKDTKYAIEEFKKENFQTLFSFQQELAWETEHRKLNEQTVIDTFKFFIKNKGLGYYYVIKLNDKVIGCTMINFGNNLFKKLTVNWIQSVFVDKNYRKKGVFTQLYNHIQNLHKQNKKNLRLFVEVENEIA